MDYAGKTVWITGASSGIGRAVAMELSTEKDISLVLSSRNESALVEVGELCREKGAGCYVQPLDLFIPEQLDLAAEQVLDRYGSVDVMVHCAGVSQRSSVTDSSPQLIRKMMEVNFFGAVELTRRVLPHMLKNEGGQFIVVSSIVGKFGFPLRSGYSAAKHALHGYFETMRAELHDRGIKVTIVCPGSISTDISKHAMTSEGSFGKEEERLQKGMPVKICAKKIISAGKKEKKEAYIGGKEIWMVHIKRFFPALFEKIVRKLSKNA